MRTSPGPCRLGVDHIVPLIAGQRPTKPHEGRPSRSARIMGRRRTLDHRPYGRAATLDGADAEFVVDDDLAAKDSSEDKHPRRTCKDHVLEGAEFTLVLGELIRGKDGELGLLGNLVLAQLCRVFALPVAAVLAVVNDLANDLTAFDDLVDDVGTLCALLDAPDAVAFESSLENLEEFKLRALAMLVRGLLLELALNVGEVFFELHLHLEEAGALRVEGGNLVLL